MTRQHKLDRTLVSNRNDSDGRGSPVRDVTCPGSAGMSLPVQGNHGGIAPTNSTCQNHCGRVLVHIPQNPCWLFSYTSVLIVMAGHVGGVPCHFGTDLSGFPWYVAGGGRHATGSAPTIPTCQSHCDEVLCVLFC